MNAPDIVYHLDYNSREVQEWLAQAWQDGFDTAGRWLLYAEPFADEVPENPFEKEEN